MDKANALRTIHRFLDGTNKYGSQTCADGAKKAVEQVITDLNLHCREVEGIPVARSFGDDEKDKVRYAIADEKAYQQKLI